MSITLPTTTPQGLEKSEEAARKSHDENSKTTKASVVAGPSPGERREKGYGYRHRQDRTCFRNKWIILTIIAVIAVAIAVAFWMALKPSGPGAGFVSGNGRIEATEINVATKLPGRVQNIMVNEGDFVQVGESLAQMQNGTCLTLNATRVKPCLSKLLRLWPARRPKWLRVRAIRLPRRQRSRTA